MDGFVGKIFDQTFSNHPYLFLFILVVAGGTLTHSYNVFAQKEEVAKALLAYSEDVDKKFGDLEKKIDDNNSTLLDLFSDMAMRDYTSEIHTLTELDKAGNANQRDRKRLRELKRDLEQERDMMRDRQHGSS